MLPTKDNNPLMPSAD